MKVILTGSTGFIGGEVLTQCLSHPSITSLVLLTRRPLPDTITSKPTVQVITLVDFTSYPPELLSRLTGAEACIWALGSPAHKNLRLRENQDAEVGITLSGAEALSSALGPALKARGQAFRFVYLSGAHAQRAPSKKKSFLWLVEKQLRIKGRVENGLLRVKEQVGSNVEFTISRPGAVLTKGTWVPRVVRKATGSIRVDELAAFMVSAAVQGDGGTRTWENGEMLG